MTSLPDFADLLTPEDLMWERGPLSRSDLEETLCEEKSDRNQSKREDNARTAYVGVEPTLVFADACKTVIVAPSITREQACAVACASIRRDLQKATLEHINARQRGLTHMLPQIEARISSLRDDLSQVDHRAWASVEAPKSAPRGFRAMLASLLQKIRDRG